MTVLSPTYLALVAFFDCELRFFATEDESVKLRTLRFPCHLAEDLTGRFGPLKHQVRTKADARRSHIASSDVKGKRGSTCGTFTRRMTLLNSHVADTITNS